MITIEGLNYDKTLHTYILDKDYYSEISAITLSKVLRSEDANGIDALITSKLRKASLLLANYIGMKTKQDKYMKYLICHYEDKAEVFREALIELMNYWIENGIDSSILNPITDIEKNTALNKNTIRDSIVPYSVEMILYNGGLLTSWYITDIEDNLYEDWKSEEDSL